MTSSTTISGRLLTGSPCSACSATRAASGPAISPSSKLTISTTPSVSSSKVRSIRTNFTNGSRSRSSLRRWAHSSRPRGQWWRPRSAFLLGHFKKSCEFFAAAYALAVDEDLRRSRDVMLRLESVDFVAGRQQMVFEGQTCVVEHALGQQSVWAHVIRQDHPVQYNVVIFRHYTLVSC